MEKSINIHGVIFTYSYNRSLRVYEAEGQTFTSKEEMIEHLHGVVNSALIADAEGC